MCTLSRVEEPEHNSDLLLARTESCGITNRIPVTTGVREQSGLYLAEAMTVFQHFSATVVTSEAWRHC